ncbi:uncharacterized protein LOC106664403 isoform X2 [Cimex lectularius]|uniref:Transmembrane protein 65 n=1 Tax=Cimex lectularius TaxID=79782 RepID=A0A8I6RKU5_CIMLE|nr:uncharacterized protein LOC106664403 isoform X2 [Cimex lectularius]
MSCRIAFKGFGIRDVLSRVYAERNVKRYHLSSRLFPSERLKNNAPPLTNATAKTLVMKLTEKERTILQFALKEFEAELRKEEYRGQLAGFRWRSKFGRPTKCTNLGDVDPTGSYCPLPEDWLSKKCAQNVTQPTTPQLFQVLVHNAIPFVGFGFLDNFVMIICGDYIEFKLGSLLVMSTMAAAALGNTLSDVLGIGSAYYVELAALKIGFKPPDLCPIQLAMSCSKMASNLGRVVGVTIGCLLGMLPLLFINTNEEDKTKTKTKTT